MRELNLQKPRRKPKDIRFSSGPVKKFKGWRLEDLKGAALGRSHRSETGKKKIKALLTLTREILKLPKTYKIALVPGSDTGAVEMAIWNLIGARGVDIAAWEKFGLDWVTDLKEHLFIEDLRIFTAEYGHLPDLSQVSGERDLILTWNGTTSGVRIPNADFIDQNREGLVICDATSAVFAQELDWNKLDAVTYSWQKVLGGEAAHGMLILSPRALKRLSEYKPAWPVPKVMRLRDQSGVLESLFEGHTINTPSLLCIEDMLQILQWIQQNGGLDMMLKRADTNKEIVDEWVLSTPWVENLCSDPSLRSNTGICLKISDPEVQEENHGKFIMQITNLLAENEIAYDIANHRDAPAGLRLWCGGTVEAEDLQALLPWLDWAFQSVKQNYQTAPAFC